MSRERAIIFSGKKKFLDNIIWHTLTGAQDRHATGSGDARRYSVGFSPIAAFAKSEHPDFDALVSHCNAGEHFYRDGWSGAAPVGWKIDAESTMFKMVWDAAAPSTDEAPDAIRIGPEHLPQVLDLAALTRPGLFGPKTIELGEYFGCFEGDRLIAMAGERTCADGFREISGVCVHPDFQGRGLARRLMRKLIYRHMQRGETPSLHVMLDNVGAHQLYQRMGFVDYRESVVRVISPS